MSSVPGVGSGLEVNSSIEQLMTIECHALDHLIGQLQSASAFLTRQLAVLSTIKYQ